MRPLRRPTTENAKPSSFAQQNGDISEDIKVESTEVFPLKDISDKEQKLRFDKKPTSTVADTIKLERKEVSTKPEPGNLKHYFNLLIASVCVLRLYVCVHIEVYCHRDLTFGEVG